MGMNPVGTALIASASGVIQGGCHLEADVINTVPTGPGATMIEFELLAQGCYRPDQVIMHYDPTFRMPITPAIQAWMDTTWEQQLAQAQEKGTRLFDAPLFRYVQAASYP